MGTDSKARPETVSGLSGQTHTPGPWSTCGKDGACPCSVVGAANGPVAEVTRGEWGDTFPDLRLVEPAGTIGNRVEAFINLIPYGHVSDETAIANARLIASAPDLLDACRVQGFALAEAYRIVSSVSGGHTPTKQALEFLRDFAAKRPNEIAASAIEKATGREGPR